MSLDAITDWLQRSPRGGVTVTSGHGPGPLLKMHASLQHRSVHIEAATKWANREEVVGVAPVGVRDTASESMKSRANEAIKAATGRSDD
jgi:hypothetical protein